MKRVVGQPCVRPEFDPNTVSVIDLLSEDELRQEVRKLRKQCHLLTVSLREVENRLKVICTHIYHATKTAAECLDEAITNH